MIFGSGAVRRAPSPAPAPPAPVAAPPPSRRDEFEIDDSQQSQLLPPARPAPPPPSLLGVLAYPFQVLGSLFRFIFGILHIPLPPFLSLNTLSRRTPSNRGTGTGSRRDPKSQARIWIRELEEEIGAVTIASRSSAVDNSAAAGSSSGARRRAPVPTDSSGPKYLPNFLESSYEDALRTAQSTARVLCVVLVSSEHDDDPKFKRSTLTSSHFLEMLEENDFLVWGGDVKQPDAHSASVKLSCTTYPFVGFIALQPSRGSRTVPAPTTMTVLSRHPGLKSCNADALCNHLSSKLVPRVVPFLERLREERAEAERAKSLRENSLAHERELRRMQDQAFADSARKDTERIRHKMAEEQRLKQEEEERQRQHEAFLQEEEARRLKELQREQELVSWRQWAIDNTRTNDEGDIRVAVRLPNGERLMRKFQRSHTLTTLYTFVDASILAQQGTSSATTSTSSLPVDQQVQELVRQYGESSLWPFTVINAYPRLEIPWKANATLGEVACLQQGGQVVVEMRNSSRKGRASMDSKARSSLDSSRSNGSRSKQAENNQDDDDEYLTESDEE